MSLEICDITQTELPISLAFLSYIDYVKKYVKEPDSSRGVTFISTICYGQSTKTSLNCPVKKKSYFLKLIIVGTVDMIIQKKG